MRALLAACALLLAACATTPEAAYWSTYRALAEARAGMNRAQEADDLRVELCFARHPALQGDALRGACPPRYDAEARLRAFLLAQDGFAMLEAIEPLVGGAGASDPDQVDRVLSAVEAMAVELILLRGGP